MTTRNGVSRATRRRKGLLSVHLYTFHVRTRLGRLLTNAEYEAMREARLEHVPPSEFVARIIADCPHSELRNMRPFPGESYQVGECTNCGSTRSTGDNTAPVSA